MVGHFRHFIAHFAWLARPLNNHLEGDASKLKAHKVVLSQKAKGRPFSLLKQALLQAPVLKFADYSKPFVLETDASSNGLGSSFAPGREGWKATSHCLREPISD